MLEVTGSTLCTRKIQIIKNNYHGYIYRENAAGRPRDLNGTPANYTPQPLGGAVCLTQLWTGIMYVCMYTYVCACMRTCVCRPVYVCMYTCMYVCMCTYV